MLVAVEGDTVLGHLQITETRRPGEIEIKNMAVDPACRRRGVGRAGYYAFHATGADLLRPLARGGEVAAAYERAAAIAPTDAERDFLRRGGRATR